MNNSELLKLIKDYIKEKRKPYIAFNELKNISGLGNRPLLESIGVLKDKKKLGESTHGRAKFYFPMKMIDIYIESDEL